MARAIDRDEPSSSTRPPAATAPTSEALTDQPARLPTADETVGTQARTEARHGISTFRSLRHRNYRLLWIGTLFSSSGLWLQQVTINWLAFSLSGSSFVVGLASGARSLPLLALGPVGGVMADRYNKKRLMLLTQVAQLLLTLAFGIIIISGWVQVWHLFAFSLLSGVAWALNMPVRQSVVPTTVPREDMMNAMALNSAGFNITRIVGPALAGIMITTVGPGENFLIQSAAYLGVAISVMQLRLPEVKQAARDVNVWGNLKEGARYVWGHATLRTQMTLALVPVMIALPCIAILPQFNEDNLGGSAGSFGLLMAAPGLGAVTATLALASMKNIEQKGAMLLVAVFALGISLIALSLSPTLWVALPILVVVGGCQMAYMTTNQTVLQLSTPDEYRGRVMGIYMLNQGMLPLGSLFSGTIADVWSAPIALAVMGGLVALMTVVFFVRAPTIRAMVVA
ncbi:MAG: MFS transporter [Chloroflexi bacterium]|nr:MFS transporter [Chloroflexota bacterium]